MSQSVINIIRRAITRITAHPSLTSLGEGFRAARCLSARLGMSFPLVLGAGLLALTLSCSSIDCPVQNTVAVDYAVPDTLKDTLSVWSPRADGTDVLLLNRATGVTVFSLPVGYQNPEDTLIFCVADTSHVITLDTVFLQKTDTPHFESVDCAPHFFHHLTGVRHTRRGIDSIVISNPSVTYDQTVTHIKLYFAPRH